MNLAVYAHMFCIFRTYMIIDMYNIYLQDLERAQPRYEVCF